MVGFDGAAPDSWQDVAMNYVEANGIRFAYLEEGEGPLDRKSVV